MLPYLKPLKWFLETLHCLKVKDDNYVDEEQNFEDNLLKKRLHRNTSFSRQMTDAHEKKDEEADPYLLYGYGISAYFNFIKWLFWIFIGLSALHLPAIVIFSFSKGIEGSDYGYYSKLSLGSAVSTTPVCFNAPVKNDRIEL